MKAKHSILIMIMTLSFFAVSPVSFADKVKQTDNQSDVKQVSDPLQGFNRAMFRFNDFIDTYIMKPVATAYNKILPTPLNQGIHNFFLNIGELPVIANDFLQLNFYQFANDFWRLAINTTVGIGGLFDIATRIHLPHYANDFGLTLSTWGYQNSTYIVLPFFGPNTIRDGIGLPVDYFAFSIYPRIQPQSTRYQLYGLGVVDRRAQLLGYQGVFEEAAVDKYVFMRNAYLQNRNYQIEQNKLRGYAAQQNRLKEQESNAPIVSSDSAKNASLEAAIPAYTMENEVAPKRGQ